MLPFGTLNLVRLLCSVITVCVFTVGANASSQCHCCRKTSLEKEHNIPKTVCLPPEAGFSCCGNQAFNPATATCCKEGHGSNVTAFVTEGLSTEVSSCCGLKAFDSLNEICCGRTIIAKPGPNSQCCGQEAIDVDEKLCCGTKDNKRTLLKKSSDHVCCGRDKQYNKKTECCCFIDQRPEIQSINHSCCNNEPELRCGPTNNKTILKRISIDHVCCGPDKQYNKKTECCLYNTSPEIHPLNSSKCELRCGPTNNKKILKRISIDHVCCGPNKQYNKKTECCLYNTSPEIHPLNSSKCGVQQQKHRASPKCNEAHTHVCGSACYALKKILGCKKNQTKFHLCSVPGHSEAAPAVCSPHSHTTCDGCVSEWTPQTEQFNRRNCCGTEVSDTEICCNGHRHPKVGHTYCCGTRAYDITNHQIKCCSGILYNLTLLNMSKDEVQCCGSALKTKQDVCCLGEDKEVLYSAKKGFRCCAHSYYNTSLWSCSAGWLSPKHHQKRRTAEPILRTMDKLTETHHCEDKPILRTMDNLTETLLCEEIHIGIVASVSQHQLSIAFNNVLKIHGKSGTVTSLASPQILKTPDRCNFPKVSPGKTYFFIQDHMYTDFNHDSILQSIHFIFTKCSHQ